ncbi:YqaJ-like viral recombinase domain [Metamycoplasma cloacale]|nr:YqaJ-like viral recombinase domain [Metamycoplasma cloacale]
MIYKPPKRFFYNESEYVLDNDNQVLVLKPHFHKKLSETPSTQFGGFRKMTGSALGDILEVSQYSSEFAAFARICGLSLPVLDRKYVNAGQIIEPKILELVEVALNEKLQRFNAVDYQYDYFKENKLFGGLPDGYAKEKNLIIEIKTTNEKNKANWETYGLPLGYLKQAQLYAYLIGAPAFSIVAIFLKDQDYLDPAKVNVHKRYVSNYTYHVNENQVKDDLNYCEAWYKRYTTAGISPKWKSIDADLLEYLKCKNLDEWSNLYNKWVEEGKAVPENE